MFYLNSLNKEITTFFHSFSKFNCLTKQSEKKTPRGDDLNHPFERRPTPTPSPTVNNIFYIIYEILFEMKLIYFFI